MIPLEDYFTSVRKILARTYLPLKDNLLLGAISQLSEKSRLGARRSKIANEWGRNHAKPHER